MKIDIGIIIAIVITTFIGFWVFYVPWYVISDFPTEELEEVNPILTIVTFIILSIAILILINIPRLKKLYLKEE